MNTTKCDICKKPIKEEQNKYYLMVKEFPWLHLDICESCGKPFEAIVKKCAPARS